MNLMEGCTNVNYVLLGKFSNKTSFVNFQYTYSWCSEKQQHFIPAFPNVHYAARECSNRTLFRTFNKNIRLHLFAFGFPP